MIQNHYHNTSERNEHILPWYHRKTNRLKDYDYSNIGAYFITICIQERHEILCKIVGTDDLGCPLNNIKFFGRAQRPSPTMCQYRLLVMATIGRPY